MTLEAQIVSILKEAKATVLRWMVRTTPRPARGKKLSRSLKRYHKNAEAAKIVASHFNRNKVRAIARLDPALFVRAVEFQLIGWPRRIFDDVHGRDVLDVGCGTGLESIGYLVTGVRSYTGIDPKLEYHEPPRAPFLDSSLVKHPDTRKLVNFGWTPRQVAAMLPNVELLPGTFEDMKSQRTFDVTVLHNVTEHLMQIDQVFEQIRSRLRPGGLLIFHHHNFYCWNGHHRSPKYVDLIEPSDAEQRKFIDWNHLVYVARPDDYIVTKLNRIRLGELRRLADRHFEIETWEEKLSDERRGGGRLTDEILAHHPGYTARELGTHGVFCRARRL